MVDSADSKISSGKLSRGMCHGTCPVYDVVLRRDGRARWHGEAFTDRVGEFEGQFNEGDFSLLARFIDRTGFFEWRDDYVAPVTDNSTYELEVVRGGDRKGVFESETDEPPDFWVIAAVVDSIASSIEWVARQG